MISPSILFLTTSTGFFSLIADSPMYLKTSACNFFSFVISSPIIIYPGVFPLSSSSSLIFHEIVFLSPSLVMILLSKFVRLFFIGYDIDNFLCHFFPVFQVRIESFPDFIASCDPISRIPADLFRSPVPDLNSGLGVKKCNPYICVHQKGSKFPLKADNIGYISPCYHKSHNFILIIADFLCIP